MTTLINIELFKIFKKWRTYIGFIAVALLVLVIQLAISISGRDATSGLTGQLSDSFIMVGNLLNGYFVSYMILNSIIVNVPFLIVLVAGDMLAGEATAGTYRILLTRPVSRFQVVLSKFLTSIIYSYMLIFWLAILSFVLGIILFGTGELIVLQNGLIIFAKDDIIWRFILAYFMAGLSMCTVAALAFFFSSLVENAIGPIITAMAIIIVFAIISAIPIDFFQTIKPYLFTNYLFSWRLFFDDSLNYVEIIKSLSVLLGHILVLFGITAYIFEKKDILT
ncbi:MAG: ABC transporter permease subunit [Bacteroidetes bacterium]|nr:ABC transporter permease subunit [Bacteroidota bacterium]MCH8942222.1 ABC transporter permease subunit [Bacteroidota bacterium]